MWCCNGLECGGGGGVGQCLDVVEGEVWLGLEDEDGFVGRLVGAWFIVRRSQGRRVDL